MLRNGEIPTVMATETILAVPTATASRLTLHNGPMLTTMVMETTLSIRMVMVSQKETPTSVLKPMANPTPLHLEDVLIPMVMASQIQKMPSQTSHFSGLIRMETALVTTCSSPMVTSASKSMVKAQKTVFKDAQIPMEMDMLIHLVIS